MTRIFINLPVADVERSATFYTAIGATLDARFSQPGVAASLAFSDTITVMALGPEHFARFSPRPPADSHATAAHLLCLSQPDRAAVDAMTLAAAAAGGVADPCPVQDHGFMYGRSFEDPDGHIWEPMWMDVPAALAAMGQTPAATPEQEAAR